MKKSLLFVTSLLSSTVVFSGTMGVVQEASTHQFSPYLVAEGAYSWNEGTTLVFQDQNLSKHNNGWGGRFGGGIIRPVAESWAINFEGGLGYYGQPEKVLLDAVSVSQQLYGFDMLLGGTYNYNKISLYVKGGAMVENKYVVDVQYLDRLIQGNLITGVMRNHKLETQLLPEIKVGGIYALNDNLGLTLSYLRTFAPVNNGHSIYNISANANGINVYTSSYQTAPSINSFLFGLQYTFS